MLLLLGAINIAQVYYNSDNEVSEFSDFYLLIQLLLKTSLFFVIGIIVIAIVSVLIPFLIFQFGKKSKYKNMLLAATQKKDEGQLLGNIPFYLKPALGKLQCTIWYKEPDLAPSFISRLPIGNVKITIPAPHIRVYQVQELDILFSDFLGMLRLPASLHSVAGFSKFPELVNDHTILLQPQLFQEESSVSDQIIYSPGEWLQYKPFENGDDVRRIIWKLYAKSRELMVRQQELYTDYSSKVIITAVFDMDSKIATFIPAKGLQLLLDVYKNEIFTIYHQSKKSGADVSFSIFGGVEVNTEEAISHLLTTANWQFNNHMKDLPHKGFLLIHSFVPENMLQQFQSLKFQKTPVAVVPLLEHLPNQKHRSLFWKWLFKEDKQQAAYLIQVLPNAHHFAHLQKQELHTLQLLTQ